MIKTESRPKGRVKVTFVLPGDTAPASVVGDFNDWDPHEHPMKKRSNGTRSASVEVPQGTQMRFRYLLDGGEWRDEPDAEVLHDDGTAVSVVRV